MSTATATTQSTLLAVYADHDAAEAAVKLLQKEGLPMHKLSIVGQDFTTIEKPLGFVTTSNFHCELFGVGTCNCFETHTLRFTGLA